MRMMPLFSRSNLHHISLNNKNAVKSRIFQMFFFAVYESSNIDNRVLYVSLCRWKQRGARSQPTGLEWPTHLPLGDPLRPPRQFQTKLIITRSTWHFYNVIISRRPSCAKIVGGSVTIANIKSTYQYWKTCNCDKWK